MMRIELLTKCAVYDIEAFHTSECLQILEGKVLQDYELKN